MRLDDYWLENKKYIELIRYHSDNIKKLYNILGNKQIWEIGANFTLLGQMARPSLSCSYYPTHSVIWIVDINGSLDFIEGREHWIDKSMLTFIKYMMRVLNEQ